MSFEEYFQILCKNGHYSSEDCYCFDETTWKCDVCDALADWINLVDLTNGSWDEDGNRIDNWIDVHKFVRKVKGGYMCKDCHSENIEYIDPAYILPPEGIGRRLPPLS